MQWSEEDSGEFMAFGAYFVPDRDLQISTICELVGTRAPLSRIAELCCGEGLLTRALLERFSEVQVRAYDGSDAMLAATRKGADARAERLDTQRFDLSATDWRGRLGGPDAVVSSLAVHHLDGPGKQRLFRDLRSALAPGGIFVLADLVAPAAERGRRIAAKAWDDAVRAQALALDGNLVALERFRKDVWNYYADPDPDPMDQPSSIAEHLRWLEEAGFEGADMHWMRAGHAIMSAHAPA